MSATPGLLENRSAVVTGGARGLGHAIAEAFLRAGAKVTIGDLDADAARETANGLRSLGSVEAIGVDVRSAKQVTGLLDHATEAHGAPDVMVNNAGITRDATMRTMAEEQFDDVLAVHLRGCWHGTRLAATRMRQRGTGSIINMSSLSGKVGMIGQTNYSAAKAGIVGLSKAAAKEVARHGVRVNVIAPGLIRSPMTEALPAHIWEAKVAEVALGRVGEPAEVASVALFLASDLSSYLTGTVTEVTGGRFM